MASNCNPDRSSCLRVVTVLAFVLTMLATKPNVAMTQCQGDPQALAEQCGPYVRKDGPKTDPSQGCCDVIKAADIACICQNIPGDVEQILDMEKLVYVAGFCGKPLDHGSHCGSYTVP